LLPDLSSRMLPAFSALHQPVFQSFEIVSIGFSIWAD